MPSVCAPSVFKMNSRSKRGVVNTGSDVMDSCSILMASWHLGSWDMVPTSTPTLVSSFNGDAI